MIVHSLSLAMRCEEIVYAIAAKKRQKTFFLESEKQILTFLETGAIIYKLTAEIIAYIYSGM